MDVKAYLASYHPITKYKEGRSAISRFGLPPFIDYSCRKEPDFMASYPSITALCRKGKFAPRLREGDIVVYITVKGKFLGSPFRHWRLTAILEVLHRFESHQKAAKWYRANNLSLPSNCMVPGNPPIPLEKTAPISSFKTDLDRWDLDYWKRSREYGDFLVCKSQYMNLLNPSIMSDEIMMAVFGKKLGTQNPPQILLEQLEQLKHECSIVTRK